MITSENITDEQIRVLHIAETERLIRAEAALVSAREAMLAANEEHRRASRNLLDAGIALSRADALDARARCAAILNERAERAKETP